MTTPLYVVAGFLDSGKTTFISRMLRHCRRKEILVLQFEEGEQIFCKGSGEDYLYTISYKAVGDQIEKVSLWFSEKQLLSDGEKERNFQYNESLFALDSFETESVKYCLDKMRKKDNFI